MNTISSYENLDATVGFVTIHPSTASKFLTVPNADQAGSNPVPFSQFVSNYYGMMLGLGYTIVDPDVASPTPFEQSTSNPLYK